MELEITFLCLAGFITAIFLLVVLSMFRKRPTDDEIRAKEVALAEADAVSQLTRSQEMNRFDRWFGVLLEEGGTGLSPFTASLIVFAVVLLFGGGMFVLTDSILLAVGMGMISFVFPFVYWTIRRERRISKMRKQLPEALESLGDGIRSGMNLELAMEQLVEQLEEPLKAEFQYGVKQLALGLSPALVMQRMARRIPVAEFRIFTTAVLVHRRTGGNLALLAERLAKSARDRTEFNSLLRAVSAGSRMSMIGLVIVTLVAMFFLAGLNQEYLYAFIASPYGPQLIGISVALIFIGTLWAWRIMKIQY
ncbi:MAG: type II secretion system F family protein [Planctomycetia bacterium]|nr:type II secretion system F family protein [Planctomycetia bacterium]